MIYHLTLILTLQLIGEVIARGLALIIPGPVIGMALFVILMMSMPKLFEQIRATAMGLLAHLSLLFVPAGVGVVGHINTLGSDALTLLLAIFVSSVAAIVVGVYAFLVTARLMGQADE